MFRSIYEYGLGIIEMGNIFYLFNMQLQSHCYFPCISILCKYFIPILCQNITKKNMKWNQLFEYLSVLVNYENLDLNVQNMILFFNFLPII